MPTNQGIAHDRDMQGVDPLPWKAGMTAVLDAVKLLQLKVTHASMLSCSDISVHCFVHE
jgi:hypothetical protein